MAFRLQRPTEWQPDGVFVIDHQDSGHSFPRVSVTPAGKESPARIIHPAGMCRIMRGGGGSVKRAYRFNFSPSLLKLFLLPADNFEPTIMSVYVRSRGREVFGFVSYRYAG